MGSEELVEVPCSSSASRPTESARLLGENAAGSSPTRVPVSVDWPETVQTIRCRSRPAPPTRVVSTLDTDIRCSVRNSFKRTRVSWNGTPDNVDLSQHLEHSLTLPTSAQLQNEAPSRKSESGLDVGLLVECKIFGLFKLGHQMPVPYQWAVGGGQRSVTPRTTDSRQRAPGAGWLVGRIVTGGGPPCSGKPPDPASRHWARGHPATG